LECTVLHVSSLSCEIDLGGYSVKTHINNNHSHNNNAEHCEMHEFNSTTESES